MRSRIPHHREAEKQAEARARAYNVAIFVRFLRKVVDYKRFLRNVPPHCPKDAGMRLGIWSALEEVEPILADEEGTVRL